jgi:hypothetical protein
MYHIFQHRIKRNKINIPHIYQTKMDMSDRYRLRGDNSPVMFIIIYNIFISNNDNFSHTYIPEVPQR